MTYDASPATKTADGLPTASHDTSRDVLREARANGARRLVRGLKSLRITVDPLPTVRGELEPGSVLTVETTGRELSYHERARLIAYLDREYV